MLSIVNKSSHKIFKQKEQDFFRKHKKLKPGSQI